MKRILLLTLAVNLYGCGSDSSGLAPLCKDATARGVWDNVATNDLLSLDITCEGSSSACQSSFTYSAQITQGITSIDVHSTNGAAGCPGLGMHTCSISFTPNMHLNCGTGEIVYTRVSQ